MEVTFQPGNEKLSIRQEFKGIDEHDHLVMSTTMDGRIPEVPYGSTVKIEPYSEIYHYSNNRKPPEPGAGWGWGGWGVLFNIRAYLKYAFKTEKPPGCLSVLPPQ